MLQIGITGGIGSGKTTVCQIFERLGVPVFYADTVARDLLTTKNVLIEVVDLLGEEALTNERLNRKSIAQIVFSNPEKLEALNQIIHPKVSEAYRNWKRLQNAPYIIKEAAILIESGGYKEMDKLILITAPEELKVKRVIARDTIDETSVVNRIHTQWSDEEKRKFCDYEIKNDEKTLILPQIIKLHKDLIV